MNFNATFFGQLIAFAVFVWFCMKFVWPLLLDKIQAREQRIADGLAAAAAGQKTLEEAQKTLQRTVGEGKEQAAELIRQAERRGGELMEQAREQADAEGKRRLALAEQELEQSREKLRRELRQELGALALVAAEQILRREVDAKAHGALIEELGRRL